MPAEAVFVISGYMLVYTVALAIVMTWAARWREHAYRARQEAQMAETARRALRRRNHRIRRAYDAADSHI